MVDTVQVPVVPGRATDNDDVTVTDVSGGVVLLEANPKRRSALIINVGEVDMRVTTDGSAPTPTHGKLVPAGSSLNLQSPFCPADQVKATVVTAATTTSANASEVS